MLMVCGLLTALALGAVQAPVSTSGANLSVTIDGSKEPGKLPNWLVWEHGFTVLSAWAGKDSGLTRDLRTSLTAAEFTLVDREALAQQDRRAAAARAIEELRGASRGWDPRDPKTARVLEERTFQINLRYRRATLDARDRVLARLGPSAQSALLAWMDDGRRSITVTVPKAGMARWRAPE